MKEQTYDLQDILTETEQLTLLRLMNALDQWLESDVRSSLLVPACRNILSGRVTRKDLAAARTCLMFWQQMHDELPKARQDHALSARIILLTDKLTRFCTTPAA